LEFAVQPTSKENGDDHDFGVVNAVRRSWCVCKAGASTCIHDGMACHDQIRIWAPDYSGDAIATAGNKKWKYRGADRLRTYDVMKPFRYMTFEALVRGRTTPKQARKCLNVT
jgi:hypothetical protein